MSTNTFVGLPVTGVVCFSDGLETTAPDAITRAMRALAEETTITSYGWSLGGGRPNGNTGGVVHDVWFRVDGVDHPSTPYHQLVLDDDGFHPSLGFRPLHRGPDAPYRGPDRRRYDRARDLVNALHQGIEPLRRFGDHIALTVHEHARITAALLMPHTYAEYMRMRARRDRPNCDLCADFGYPVPHWPSLHCRSGNAPGRPIRPHCTCDVCF
ncbi:hypothetical protein [Embleya sp. NPDC059237]|uniref:hypothetical protein n=1 Tax=Embleya sp. NPDC059237 TaxID=3346784 RepID=UPI0036CCC857